ncbi:MAG: ASCH domain-containing protein [Planctomycetes bacterium]|nr:ASCH domain-containing protein [Planctomycetota bacterium]
MLLFKKKFLPAIRQGEKTQTIRLWKWRMMRAGQRSYIPGAGYIRIDQVEQVRLEELTDEDAIPDGFATADALRTEINEIYAEKVAAGYQAYRVVFHLLEEMAPQK